MYLTGIGYGMIIAGISINDFNESDPPPGAEISEYLNLLFAGGFLTTIFWVR